MIKIITIFILFFSLPWIFRALIHLNVSRGYFSLISAMLLSTVFFILAVLFSPKDPLLIGSILFVMIFVGGYTTQYFMYPIIKRIQTRKITPEE